MSDSHELSQNRIKIVSNPNPRSLSFFLMNEKGQWVSVSNYSELSRKSIRLRTYLLLEMTSYRL